jgi:hypothetical protein
VTGTWDGSLLWGGKQDFNRFESVKFFLTRERLREVIVKV